MPDLARLLADLTEEQSRRVKQCAGRLMAEALAAGETPEAGFWAALTLAVTSQRIARRKSEIADLQTLVVLEKPLATTREKSYTWVETLRATWRAALGTRKKRRAARLQAAAVRHCEKPKLLL